MDKLTLQQIIELFAKQAGLSKKAADSVAKAFFDTIVEGLTADGIVKINGLGTFKVVEVAERESINVNNGERIVIPGYKKVNFLPAESMVAVPVEEAPNEPTEEENYTEEPAMSEVQLDHPDLSNVEQPQNEFSAIDMLIATPESIDDVRTQYEQARQQASETLKAANEAHAEMMRLGELLQRLEANMPPVTLPEETTAQEAPSPAVAEESVEAAPEETAPVAPPSADESPLPQQPAVPASSDEALHRYLNDKPIHDEDEKHGRKTSWLWWLLIPILGLLLAEIAILLYKYKEEQSSAPVEQVSKPQPQQSPVPQPAPRPKAKARRHAQPDAPAAKPAPATKPAPTAQPHNLTTPQPQKTSKPQNTYVMKPGDSLTKLSQRFYGTKDSVRAIIRLNKFPNPDNVPVGATVKLP